MAKVVGIDIDCTLTELFDPTIEKMAAFYDKPIPSMDMVRDYNLSTAFNITEEESLAFWGAHEADLVVTSKLSKERHQSIVNNYIEAGSEIYIITNRPRKHLKATYQWLVENDVSFDHLIHTDGKSKIPHIKRLGIEVMIDDNPTVFREAFEQGITTKMVCVDYPYNIDAPCHARMTLEGEVYDVKAG